MTAEENAKQVLLETYFYDIEAFVILVDSINNQIPKRPVVKQDKKMFGVICGNCPECDSDVYSTTNMFCHGCGQALDWSEENDL